MISPALSPAIKRLRRVGAIRVSWELDAMSAQQTPTLTQMSRTVYRVSVTKVVVQAATRVPENAIAFKTLQEDHVSRALLIITQDFPVTSSRARHARATLTEQLCATRYSDGVSASQMS